MLYKCVRENKLGIKMIHARVNNPLEKYAGGIGEIGGFYYRVADDFVWIYFLFFLVFYY